MSAFLSSFRPFLSGLCLRPILLSPVVFLLAIVWANLGTSYGIPEQLFHEVVWKQWTAGLGASLLLLQVCVVAFLLDHDSEWVKAIPKRDSDPTHQIDRQMRWYLDRSWLPLVAAVGASVWWEPAARWPFLVGLLVPVAVYFVVRVIRQLLPAMRPAKEPRAEPVPGWAWVVEIGLHLAVILVGAFLIGFYIPTRDLHAQCLVVACWLALHGLLLFLFRLWRMPEEDERRMHRRAGLAFGGFFLVYMGLFFVYWYDATGEVAAWAAPPALVCFLLLCLIVTIHGFLAYNFRGWYVLVALVLFGVVAAVNGLPRYKLHFPNLDYDQRTHLSEGDFEAVHADVVRRTAELRETPDDDTRRGEVMARFLTMMKAHTNLQLRWFDRLKLDGKFPTNEELPQGLPNGLGLVGMLRGQQWKQADDAYKKAREFNDVVGWRLAKLEYESLDAWKKQATGKDGMKPKLIVVAVSGGANRSALWTMYALDQLEQEFDKRDVVLPRHVRLMSGASGGMLGSAYWVATIDPEKRKHVIDDHDEYVEKVARDSLTPLGQHALFLDVPTLLLPGEFTTDRGVALERAWSKNLDKALDRPVRELAKGEREGWLPSLVFSPMLVEDGRRLIISNQYLPFLTENAGHSLANPDTEEAESTDPKLAQRKRPRGKPMPTKEGETLKDVRKLGRDRYSLAALEFFQLFPQADKFRLSTAVRMSATFPYFSPAVDLPTTPRRRVVDAGYFDNYGIDVAAQWLYHYRDWLRENTSGVVLVQLRDGTSERRKLVQEGRQVFWDVARAGEWLTGPLVGAGAALEAGMSFRNDELVKVLSDSFNRDGRPMFTTVVFEAQEEIALSWYLTKKQIADMKTGFEKVDGEVAPNRLALDRLLTWWQRDHSPRRGKAE